MTIQYFVTAVSTCDQCNGAGYVQNAQWQRFFEKYGDAYRKAGIDESALMLCGHFGVSSVRHLPTEEETCPECDGTGIVKRQVSLAEALQAVTQ